MRATRKLRVTTRICKCECEMRVYYTKSVNYNLLNVFTETIEFTFIYKYLKSISYLLDFVSFLIYQNCDCQVLEDLFSLRPLFFNGFFRLPRVHLKFWIEWLWNGVFELKTNKNCGAPSRWQPLNKSHSVVGQRASLSIGIHHLQLLSTFSMSSTRD